MNSVKRNKAVFSRKGPRALNNPNPHTKLIVDPSVLIQEANENTVFLKTVSGKYKLAGVGIAPALRKILNCFQDAARPHDVLVKLRDQYSEDSLRGFIDFLIQKKVLITMESYDDLAGFSPDSVEKYRYLTFGGKTLNELLCEMQAMTVGIIGTMQFIRCFINHFENDQLFSHTHYLITDRTDCPSGLPASQSAVSCLGNDPEPQLREFITGCDFIIASSTYESYSLFHFVNGQCLSQKKKWLRIVTMDEQSEIGPLFIPGETCCYDCLDKRMSECQDDKATYFFSFMEKEQGMVYIPQLATYSSYYLTMLTADIAVYELMRYFSGIKSQIRGSVLRFFIDGYQMKTEKVFKHSQCAGCRNQG